jgi:DNA polymerase I-like protein with 3'-5' exonuclease and polymerase domains
MKLIFDIETNGLLREARRRYYDEDQKKYVEAVIPKLNSIWCIVAIDEHNKQYIFKPDKIKEGIEFLKSADTLIGHNIIGFDIPVIHMLHGVDLYKHCKITDTLVLSQLFNPSRDKGHNLKSWGDKFGFPKGDHTEFDKFSEEMLTYCIRDTEINVKILEALRTESTGFTKESIKLEHDTRKVICSQIENGFSFDYKKASILLAELTQRKAEVADEVKKTFKPRETEHTILINVKENQLKDGSYSKKTGYNHLTKKKTNLTQEEKEIVKTGCVTSLTRKLITEFNLGSRKQIGEYLIEFGWKPNRFTPTGQPIVDEVTLEKVKHIPEAKLISEFLLLQKRVAQVQSWLEHVHIDGVLLFDEDKTMRSNLDLNKAKVHGNVISNGAITGRMTHYGPNTAQIPSIYKPYGKDCRGCWKVEEGNVLLGIDASGLELRMLSHYMKDKEYTNEIINGDIHTANQKLARLESRNQAKTFIYALMYGAGDEKLGSVVGGNKKDGKRSRQHFFDNQPSFKSLRDRVTRASARGYLKGLDGRKIFIRNQHASLNSLLQGAGAVVMKKALVIFDQHAKEAGLQYKFVANIHDEWQVEVPKETASLLGAIGVRSIVETGEYFSMDCPLDGEYKIGNNWSETH